MEQIYKPLLAFHVLCGTVSLITGLIAMTAKKGLKVHKNSGVVYFYFMLATGVTAIPVSLYKDNIFLLVIAVFSLYLVITGYRVTQRKKRSYHWFDVAVSVVMAVTSVYMISTLNIIVAVFGSIGFLNAFFDLKGMFFPAQNPPKLAWLYGHIGKMTGSYISAVTAFLLNNIHTEFPLLIWFGPTVIGVIFMTYWTRVYKKKEKKIEVI